MWFAPWLIPRLLSQLSATLFLFRRLRNRLFSHAQHAAVHAFQPCPTANWSLSQAVVLWRCLPQVVSGSVPTSVSGSFIIMELWEDCLGHSARVRRVLVSHMEDEDDQENEKEDERDGKQRVEGRRESSNTQHERMDGMKWSARHLVLEPMSMWH